MAEITRVQNQILQSLHSAWIDELIQNFPDYKLELGLPKRLLGFTNLKSTQQTLIAPLNVQEVQGLVAWGISETQKKTELKTFAESALKRCRVHIQTHHQTELKIGLVQNFSSTEHAPDSMIWFPITIQVSGNGLVFDLGVGF